ncbi:hypothetical protein [Photobacterium galatheae]|uniref:Lipoprotein n=1 Tax=Photobacterium galatheae TaxID=1654360 RepID=A0A066RKL8_9GAMM|nr:hypothetical protein [Photobacterium galatheae]KDM90995.1 hypothetical protein EA58_14685 [Photobacterium galatheae]MCM0149049.1 hypothetical protein [Photobacterium galatheae]
MQNRKPHIMALTLTAATLSTACTIGALLFDINQKYAIVMAVLSVFSFSIFMTVKFFQKDIQIHTPNEKVTSTDRHPFAVSLILSAINKDEPPAKRDI